MRTRSQTTKNSSEERQHAHRTSPSQSNLNEVFSPESDSTDVIMQESQGSGPSDGNAYHTPNHPIQQTTASPDPNRQASSICAPNSRQSRQSIPHRIITPQSCEVMMRGINFEVGAREALPRYVLQHRQSLDDLTSHLYAAIIRYLGLQGELTSYQQADVTRFVLVILSRSQDELSNATGSPLRPITDVPTALPTHLESIVTVLWDADRKLRPGIPGEYLDEARALVRIAAMRLQRELVSEWIDALTLPQGAGVARVVDVAERDAAATTPGRKRAGRPEGSTKAKIEAAKAAKAAAKKETRSTKKAARPVLQSPYTTPTRPQLGSTPASNVASPYTNLGSIQHQSPLNIFNQTQNQLQTGYGQKPQYLVPQQSQQTPTPSDWSSPYQNYNHHNTPVSTPRAAHNASPYAGLGSIQTGTYQPPTGVSPMTRINANFFRSIIDSQEAQQDVSLSEDWDAFNEPNNFEAFGEQDGYQYEGGTEPEPHLLVFKEGFHEGEVDAQEPVGRNEQSSIINAGKNQQEDNNSNSGEGASTDDESTIIMNRRTPESDNDKLECEEDDDDDDDDGSEEEKGAEKDDPTCFN